MNSSVASNQEDGKTVNAPREGFIESACTTEHPYYFIRPSVPPYLSNGDENTAFNPIRTSIGGVSGQGRITAILELNLNNPFRPIEFVWKSAKAGAGNNTYDVMPTPYDLPARLDQVYPKYMYWKVVKSTFSIKLRHIGGWQSDTANPFMLFTRRLNMAPRTKSGNGWTLENVTTGVQYHASTEFNRKMNPEYSEVDGGQVYGPMFQYGFGDADPTYVDKNPHETVLHYEYNLSDTREVAHDTNFTHWESGSKVSSDPYNVQKLILLVAPVANSWDASTNLAEKKIDLWMEVNANYVVQWRDLDSDGYLYKTVNSNGLTVAPPSVYPPKEE